MDAQFKQAVQKVINKAWEDDSFRASLVKAPKATIAKVTGLKVPTDVDIVFSDQTDPNVNYINLPPRPNYDNMELSDEQLEIVAGGEVLATPIVVALIGLGASALGGSLGIAAAGVKRGW